MPERGKQKREVICIGGGLAGLSAAIYLARAQRDVLVIDAGDSLARWEPRVENYLGFPDGIAGDELLVRGRKQAETYGAVFVGDDIVEAALHGKEFELKGKKGTYRAGRVLLATGLLHIPPEIPSVSECLGHSMFFCKDCDGVRVRDRRIAIMGHNNDAVEYALGVLHYSPCVIVATNGHEPKWSPDHGRWLEEYEIDVHTRKVIDVEHVKGELKSLGFEDGKRVLLDSLFTTRGDVFHNKLACLLGAELDREGQIQVDLCMRTSVPGLYAAGCITPANCQMIIAAGQGAAAGQSINRDLFEESLRNHSLRRFRAKQLSTCETKPEVIQDPG